MHALNAYNAGMNSIQYTIRGVPTEVDRKLRENAHKSGKSLNGLVVETLECAVSPSGPPYNSLDWFFSPDDNQDEEEDAALQWLDQLPQELTGCD